MRLPRRGVLASTPPAPAASVDVSTIRQRFNYEWTMDPDNGADTDTYWWWACSIRVDPAEVIADDDEGNLWSIPFTTDGADEVTFGTPIRVRETFVPVAASDGAAATALVSKRRQRVLASELAKPDKPDRDNPAASRPRQEVAAMSPGIDIGALRSRTGLSETELPDDATEEQINAALTAETEVPEQAGEEAAEVNEPETPEGEAPAAASARTVTVDRAQWEATQAAAQQGQEARETQLAEQRDQLVAAAVQDGRIAPSSRQAWRDALDARPEAEATALAALSPGRIPVTERGAQTTASGEDAGYERVRASMGINTNRKGA